MTHQERLEVEAIGARADRLGALATMCGEALRLKAMGLEANAFDALAELAESIADRCNQMCDDARR